MIPKDILFSEDHQELIKPILPGLPISLFYTTFRRDTYNCINWHWHNAFQYCLVTEGSIDFLLPNTSYHVKEGNGIFINIQQVHFSKSRMEPAAYLCLDIPPSFICADEHSRIYKRYIQPVVQNPFPQALHLSRRNPHELQLLQHILDIRLLLQEQPDFMELDIQSQVMQIWKDTFRILDKPVEPFTAAPLDNDRLKIILQYMHDHYAEKISLEDISQQLSLSRNECCRFFKTATGQSMFSYLNNLRLNKSMELLKNSQLTLSEIAMAVGFCSQSYYTDCFRKSKNITPKKYRELTLRKPNDILPLDVYSQ